MDRNILEARSTNDKITVWDTQLRPLFRIATHQRVADSALMEQEAADLFNFFLGVGGRRMTKVFTWLSSVIDILGDAQMEAVELSLAVLANILDCNSTSNLNSCVREYADHFSQIVGDSSGGSETTFSQLQAGKYLDYIKRRIAVDEDIPLATEAAALPLVHGSFVLQLDLPGGLSREGARHDNDDVNIEKISIMPTMGEILSARAEYLPTTDSTQWHKQGIQGRLDREFRLLREDTVGQLRDAIRDKLEDVQQQAQGRPPKRHQGDGLRTSTYDFPTLVALDFDRNTGLELVVRFHQPEVLNSASLEKRREWWTHGKRLLEGALVCVVDSTASVLYLEVSDATRRTGLKDKDKPQEEDNKEVLSLADNADFAHVVLHLVDASDHNVGQVMRWYRSIGRSPRRYIIEFPGVMLASFKYTLQALQEMHKLPDVPFSHLIAPTSAQSDTKMRPPLYANSRGFAFCLKGSGNDQDMYLSPREEATDSEVEQIMKKTGLDETQSEAFANTMRRELSLIQGPPGTGKSFTGEKIIRMLINHRQQARLGPILCVCYTNHALDQLLEHLLKNGIDKLVRIGSRSKSEQLKGYNLREIAKDQVRTKAEGRSLCDLYGHVGANVDEMVQLLQQLSASNSQQSIKQFIKVYHPEHYRELFGDDSEGYTTVHHRREYLISDWLKKKVREGQPGRSLNRLLSSSLLSMTSAERRTIHQYWLRKIRDPIITQIIRKSREHGDTREHMGRVRQEVDLRCLQEAHVVGLTTTGLARNLQLLRKLRCKVLVCEEAGEVLEAHILTALLPSIEHAILIGDHQQLRPQIQNYELQSTNPRGARYSLDMSLFERLVQPPHSHDVQLPFQTLETQRRMHPAIAAFVRKTLYPRLVDGDNVQDYPEIPGMKQRLFWFHHEELEAAASAQDANSTSHWNAFEVEMTVALVSHLVRQGVYGPDDIAVITPYLGQLHKLRHRMESMFEVCLNQRDQEDLEAFEAEKLDGSSEVTRPSPVAKTTLLRSVRVATVDNFQGEEAKVVVVSLVRSNAQNRCGFLSTSNRINVLLSRAQHGMYLLGNAATYGHVSMWADVIALLQARGNFGTSFELQCPRHPSTPILVSQPDHFAQRSPESGCALPCEKRHACGHHCHGRCHSDVLHAASKCLEPCPRPQSGCTHACPRLCGDPCPDRCMARLTGVQLSLPCGHVVSLPLCWQKQNPSAVRCPEFVKREVPGCHHTVRVPCYEDTKADRFKCNAICDHKHPCGHACKRHCSHCRVRKDGQIVTENHGVCKQPCGRLYSTCQHTCGQKCHSGTPCGPCQSPCETRCRHSQCSKRCNEPCSPCAEATCSSRCQHSQCTMPCAAPCDWVPCSLRCDKILACGHSCPSVCGETCPEPKYCQQCGSEDIQKTVVDFLEMKEYREINLDEEPCIFPQCGHFLTMASMDGMMDMAAHYTMNGQGLPSCIKASTKPFSMDEVKVCATCRKSLSSIGRYGRIVRRAMLDETTKKFITWSNAEYATLSEELLDEQAALAAVPKKGPSSNTSARRSDDTVTLSKSRSRVAQMNTLSKLVGDVRYKRIMRLRQKIAGFTTRVRKDEQPFQRVKEHVEFANRRHATQGGFAFDESIIQLKGTLLAGNLMLRCELAVLFDFFQGRTEGTWNLAKETKLDLRTHLDDCLGLINVAHETNHPMQEVESHVYYAQLCHFSRAAAQENQAGVSENAPDQTPTCENYKTDGLAHVKLAHDLIRKKPAAASFQDEVDAADRLLRDGVFYKQVTREEMRTVYKAMTSEFRGTGHWYTCEQGHPFTIGECGMAMEQARCPECDSPIGGQDHVAVAGVRHAQDIEQLGTELRRVNLYR